MTSNPTRLNRRRTALATIALAGGLVLGAAMPASAQEPTFQQDRCTEETLHPEYQGMGLCDEPADPTPTTNPAPPAANPPASPDQDGCTEATLDPEFQGMGLCEEPADPNPPAAPQPGLGGLFGGLIPGFFGLF